MDEQQQSRWRPTRGQVLWTVVIIVALVVLIRIGYTHPWTGFGQTEVKEGFKSSKTLWDWLKLLIVPAVLAVGGYLFNSSQNSATQAAAEQRAQDDRLQTYLDGMAQLLTDKEQPLHRAQPGDSLSTVARARALTVLSTLDGSQKRSVLQFLYESRLIDQEQALLDESGLIERRHNIVSLAQADLGGAALISANLRNANLSYANLSDAYLIRADLIEADLRDAKLSDANLSDANLISADLTDDDWDGIGADLSSAILVGADLRNAHLIRADLRYANLSGANLSGADLSGARNITNEQLKQQAETLKSATMTNGQKYEDWLKDKKGRGEDGENSGPS